MEPEKSTSSSELATDVDTNPITSGQRFLEWAQSIQPTEKPSRVSEQVAAEAERDNWVGVKELVAEHPKVVNEVFQGLTPVHRAAQAGVVDFFRFLSNSRIDVNWQLESNDNNKTAFELTYSTTRPLQIIEILIQRQNNEKKNDLPKWIVEEYGPNVVQQFVRLPFHKLAQIFHLEPESAEQKKMVQIATIHGHKDGAQGPAKRRLAVKHKLSELVDHQELIDYFFSPTELLIVDIDEEINPDPCIAPDDVSQQQQVGTEGDIGAKGAPTVPGRKDADTASSPRTHAALRRAAASQFEVEDVSMENDSDALPESDPATPLRQLETRLREYDDDLRGEIERQQELWARATKELEEAPAKWEQMSQYLVSWRREYLTALLESQFLNRQTWREQVIKMTFCAGEVLSSRLHTIKTVEETVTMMCRTTEENCSLEEQLNFPLPVQEDFFEDAESCLRSDSNWFALAQFVEELEKRLKKIDARIKKVRSNIQPMIGPSFGKTLKGAVKQFWDGHERQRLSESHECRTAVVASDVAVGEHDTNALIRSLQSKDAQQKLRRKSFLGSELTEHQASAAADVQTSLTICKSILLDARTPIGALIARWQSSLTPKRVASSVPAFLKFLENVVRFDFDLGGITLSANQNGSDDSDLDDDDHGNFSAEELQDRELRRQSQQDAATLPLQPALAAMLYSEKVIMAACNEYADVVEKARDGDAIWQRQTLWLRLGAIEAICDLPEPLMTLIDVPEATASSKHSPRGTRSKQVFGTAATNDTQRGPKKPRQYRVIDQIAQDVQHHLKLFHDAAVPHDKVVAVLSFTKHLQERLVWAMQVASKRADRASGDGNEKGKPEPIHLGADAVLPATIYVLASLCQHLTHPHRAVMVAQALGVQSVSSASSATGSSSAAGAFGEAAYYLCSFEVALAHLNGIPCPAEYQKLLDSDEDDTVAHNKERGKHFVDVAIPSTTGGPRRHVSLPCHPTSIHYIENGGDAAYGAVTDQKPGILSWFQNLDKKAKAKAARAKAAREKQVPTPSTGTSDPEQQNGAASPTRRTLSSRDEILDLASRRSAQRKDARETGNALVDAMSANRSMQDDADLALALQLQEQLNHEAERERQAEEAAGLALAMKVQDELTLEEQRLRSQTQRSGEPSAAVSRAASQPLPNNHEQPETASLSSGPQNNNTLTLTPDQHEFLKSLPQDIQSELISNPKALAEMLANSPHSADAPVHVEASQASVSSPRLPPASLSTSGVLDSDSAAPSSPPPSYEEARRASRNFGFDNAEIGVGHGDDDNASDDGDVYLPGSSDDDSVAVEDAAVAQGAGVASPTHSALEPQLASAGNTRFQTTATVELPVQLIKQLPVDWQREAARCLSRFDAHLDFDLTTGVFAIGGDSSNVLEAKQYFDGVIQDAFLSLQTGSEFVSTTEPTTSTEDTEALILT